MTIRTTLALAVMTLTLGVPVASADPQGHLDDAIGRYLANNTATVPDGFQPQLGAGAQPDAVDRYLRNHSNRSASAFGSIGASSHPDSHAVRSGVIAPVGMTAAGGVSWGGVAGVAFGTLAGALIAALAFAGATARRFVLR